MPAKPSQKKTPKEQAPKAAGGGGKANALQQPLRPSEALAAVVGGAAPLPRGEVVSKVWDYIKAHKLQNPEDRRGNCSTPSLDGGGRWGGHEALDVTTGALIQAADGAAPRPVFPIAC